MSVTTNKSTGKSAEKSSQRSSSASASGTKSTPRGSMQSKSSKSTTASKTSRPAAKSSGKKTQEFSEDMTIKLDDKSIISDVLGCQKSLIKLYGTALCEASCDKLRHLVTTQMSECARDQFDAFLYMNSHNMYPTEPAPAPKIQKAKQKFLKSKEKMK